PSAPSNLTVIFSLSPTTTITGNDDTLGPGDSCSAVNPLTGGIYFCDQRDIGNDTNPDFGGRIFYWEPGGGMTTVINKDVVDGPAFDAYRSKNNLTVDGSGRVVFQNASWSSDKPYFWSWKPGGAVTTIHAALFNAGWDTTLVTSD